MDLNTVEAVLRPTSRAELPAFAPGDAWLAGGTWLFSEPQRHLRRLIDLSGLDWPALEIHDRGLSIGATCPIATLEAFEAPAAWRAAHLIQDCCRAFWASFKIWNTATVGGNICLALPAGPIISLAVALDATCLIWSPSGQDRRLKAADFVLAPQRVALEPGEILRRIDIPAEALERRAAFRQISLTPLGRSAALLVGSRDPVGGLRLTVTASTPRPKVIVFEDYPAAAVLQARLEAELPPTAYYSDPHGAPDWRRHITLRLAEEIRAELME